MIIRCVQVPVIVHVHVHVPVDLHRCLRDFGEDGATYLPKEDFSKLVSNEEEADVGVALKSWCVAKA